MNLAIAAVLLSTFLVKSAPSAALLGPRQNDNGLFGNNIYGFGWNKNPFGGGDPYGFGNRRGLLYGLGGFGGFGGAGPYGRLFGTRGGIFGGNSGWFGGNPANGFYGYRLTDLRGPTVSHGPGAGYGPPVDHGLSAPTSDSSYGPGVAAYIASAGYDNSNAYGYGLDGTPSNRGYGLPLFMDLGQPGLDYTGMLGYGDGYGGGYGGGTGGYGGYATGFGGYGGLLTSYQDLYKVTKPDIPKPYVYGLGPVIDNSLTATR